MLIVNTEKSFLDRRENLRNMAHFFSATGPPSNSLPPPPQGRKLASGKVPDAKASAETRIQFQFIFSLTMQRKNLQKLLF